MKSQSLKIKNLSAHLFWDVDIHKINFDKNKKLIIQRTLDYGLLSDWKIILDYYGIKKIASTATSLKDLDKKSVSLISLLSGIPGNNFLCYTTKQLTPKHWSF